MRLYQKARRKPLPLQLCRPGVSYGWDKFPVQLWYFFPKSSHKRHHYGSISSRSSTLSRIINPIIYGLLSVNCQQEIIGFLQTPGFRYQHIYTESSIPHIHTKVPTTHQGKHSAPTWPHQSVGVTAILVFSSVFKIWTKSEAKYAVPKTPRAHPLQSSFWQSIVEFENLFSRTIIVDQTTPHESEEIPHSRQKISYLNETIKHNQSNELDPSDYKHICHHHDWT